MPLLQKYKFKVILLLICLINLLFIFSAFGISETKSYPKYLIILVHGINSNNWFFIGNGENGSDTSKVQGKKAQYGDLKGYLEDLLNVPADSYVHAYTFSERDGNIALQGKELGKSDHENKASTDGGWLHHPVQDAFNMYANETGIKDGNSWFEQARLISSPTIPRLCSEWSPLSDISERAGREV